MKNLSQISDAKDIATKEYVDTVSSNKANIDSPVFTGKPKAPTPTPISAGTQIATKAYVDPVVLDTTNTYTYAYFKSLADTNRGVIINGYKVSRVWTSDIIATFDLVESFNVVGCFTYYYNGNKWEYENMTLAPIDSPTFEGVPEAPTPTSTSVGTQVATKEYVDPVIFSTGTTTYTQAEIKNAIQSNRRIIIDGHLIVNAIYSDLDCYFLHMEAPDRTGYFAWHPQTNWRHINTPVPRLHSPDFTGTPKAPTAAKGTNTTQIATTAFVQNAVSNSGIYWIQYNQTTFTETEYNKIVSLENTETAIGIYDASPGMVVAWNLGTHQMYITEDTPSNSGITLIFTTSIAKYTCFIRASNYSATWTKTLLPTTIYDNNSNAINVWTGTQEEYDALTTKDANTLYLVKSS